MDWTVASAVANVVLAIVAIVALLQLWQAVSARNAQVLIWIANQFDGMQDDLAVLHAAPDYPMLEVALAPEFASPWDSDQEAAARRVSSTLQRVGYLARTRLVSRGHVRRMWAGTVTESWRLLEVWVKVKRHRNGEPTELTKYTYTRKDFEWLAGKLAKA